jgi:hypothetical protein
MYMVSAFLRSLPQGAQSQTISSQLQGARSKAEAVKARGESLSKSNGGVYDNTGDDEDSDDERCFSGAKRYGRGAAVHIRHSRRWRTLNVGLGGGFIVQFYSAVSTISVHIMPWWHTLHTTCPQRWQSPTMSRAHWPTRPLVSRPSKAVLYWPSCSREPSFDWRSASSLQQCSVFLTS